MPDLAAIYRAFDAFEPLPADDDVRYVDFSSVRGSKIAPRLAQRIRMAGDEPSSHLVMGHTKCGKTTELNRAMRLLRENNYLTATFDVEEEIGERTFEYTAVLLLMASKVVAQLQEERIDVKGDSAKKLAEFLISKEITIGGQLSGDVAGKVEAKAAPNLLIRLLGELGLGIELRGGYQRSRQITTKIEADTRGFLEAVSKVVLDANHQIIQEGYNGLVIYLNVVTIPPVCLLAQTALDDHRRLCYSWCIGIHDTIYAQCVEGYRNICMATIRNTFYLWFYFPSRKGYWLPRGA